MPSYTRNKKREDVIFVAVNSVIRFGWKSKDLASVSGISQSDLTNDLGHTAQNAVTGSGLILVIGAQAPKPARVTKRLSNATVGQQQSISTFCAHDKLATALGKGWNLSKNRRSVTLRALSASRGSLTAIAKLSGDIHYCFPMNKADFEAYGSELGLESATNITDTERNKLVSGSSKPRPGRASKQLSDGSTFSSFYSTATDVSAVGYDILSEEIVLAVATGGGGS
ncbi:hypothetical protein VF14_11645 [Nostoc linckia z18]|uniref:Uncharacterized protein n=2 Tax=Nostoc linckia TaxID=92942 RepID=A0A9Q6EJX9_NOSLI|nr:hypothetical protein [Nostoc linckia]PHK40892.1 hypothetical protein VF12_08605 [Nostoc linckia z15]PHK46435.1 hypothetical protein VF13_10840 [Nostoc linckia z16]PHJ60235.1 hypothetical protein VF02_22995 [Nostoc linckia z1]PHJ63800.1 hypothetical protein VF05_23955 [Nostoc linckia z3]PHJ70814.1 hypothetical protein VF03_21525 [Nostoc linckia z2]